MYEGNICSTLPNRKNYLTGMNRWLLCRGCDAPSILWDQILFYAYIPYAIVSYVTVCRFMLCILILVPTSTMKNDGNLFTLLSTVNLWLSFYFENFHKEMNGSSIKSSVTFWYRQSPYCQADKNACYEFLNAIWIKIWKYVEIFIK